MKYWHRRLHLILWFIIIAGIVFAFLVASYLLRLEERQQPNPRETEILRTIEKDMRKSP